MSEADSGKRRQKIALPAKANKRGAIIFERTPSVRKVNAEREAKINFSSRVNFIFASALLLSVAFNVYCITRPAAISPVYVQYPTGEITKIDTVRKGEIPAPTATPAPQATPTPTPTPASAPEPVQTVPDSNPAPASPVQTAASASPQLPVPETTSKSAGPSSTASEPATAPTGAVAPKT